MGFFETLRGRFIVLDGPDGAGKSTQLDRLAQAIGAENVPVETVVDPGGTAIGQRIRQLLLSNETGDLSPACETMLFMASRAQLVFEKVIPALQQNKIVLGDRFISSTLAYQGALGMDLQQILDLGHHAVGDVWPDVTVILDIDAQAGLTRAGNGDRLENRPTAYHQAVRRHFQQLGDTIPYPRPVLHMSADGSIDEVHDRVTHALRRWAS
jgi:dTMP kinase